MVCLEAISLKTGGKKKEETMSLEEDNRCANCGQPALTTDNVCWHCGKPVPWFDEDVTEEVRVKEGWGLRASPSSILIYAGITVVVILALVFVMSSLAGQPKIQVSLGTRPVEGWEVVTDSGQTLTTYLPQEWTRYDGADPEQGEKISELLAENGHFLEGTNPLGGAVDDLSVAFLAQSTVRSSEGISPFMIVARSEKLNFLEYDEASIFVDEGDIAISEMRFIDNFERSHLKIVAEQELESANERLRCRQQFIRGEGDAVLLSLCAPVRCYTSQQTIFEEIANSFQRLS